MRVQGEKDLWAIALIITVTAVLIIAMSLHWIRFAFFIGPFRITHWFTWIGTIYIAFTVPIIAFFKKRFPKKYQMLYRTHMFGNLLSFLLISLHFASQISRPAEAYPDLGTGLVLYIAVLLLVSTGILQRLRLLSKVKPQTLKLLHIGSAVTFYLTISVHILHGIGIL
ncbi:hypothetical protein G4O51_06545 [Candidatus Bathyarchaeota archaeon A05DMB-2]|jgi:hypothetical protein|nr:hypothetical protein [Candidatus Bathyarchaeota archaeon A05DMB-2]